MAPSKSPFSLGFLPSLFHWLGLSSFSIKLKGPTKEEALHVACEEGDEQQASELLEDQDLEPNCPNDQGITPLLAACKKGHLPLVRLLLQDPRIEVNQQDHYGMTPFLAACLSCNLPLVEILSSDPRVDVNLPGEYGATPFLAILRDGEEGGAPIAEFLAHHPRINVIQGDIDGVTPFWLACQDEALFPLAGQLSRDPRIQLLAPEQFFVACCLGDLPRVLELLGLQQGKLPPLGFQERGGSSAASQERGDASAFQERELPFDLNWKNPNLQAASSFWIACHHGHLEIAALLSQDPRIDLNLPDEFGTPPLLATYARGHLELVRGLSQDPRIEINQASRDDITLFWLACQRGDEGLVALLLKDPRVRISQPNLYTISPFFTACENDRLGVVRLLSQDPRIEVNQPDKTSTTPFMAACQNGCLSVVEYLLRDPRIEPNQANLLGCTPLWLISQGNHLECAKALFASGRPVNLQKRGKSWHEKGPSSPLEKATKAGFRELASLIQEYQEHPLRVVTQLRLELGIREPFVDFELLESQAQGTLMLVPPPSLITAIFSTVSSFLISWAFR